MRMEEGGLEKVMRTDHRLVRAVKRNIANISVIRHFFFFFDYQETLPLIIRVEVLNTLATTCFMSSTFDTDHELARTMSTLHTFIDYMFDKPNIPPELTCAALQGCISLRFFIPPPPPQNKQASARFTLLSFI